MENTTNVLYIVSGIITFIGILYLGIVTYQTVKKKRKILFSQEKIYKYFLGFLVLAPVMVALYFIPITFYNPDFWLNNSIQNLEVQNGLFYLGISILVFYAMVRAAIFMPHENEYYNIGPKVLFLSLIPGIASAINVMIISKFITKDYDARHLLLFFAVTTFVYIVTVRISKRKTVGLGIMISHNFNMLVANKIFKIPYRKYEQIKDGKIYTILNDDIRTIFSFSQNIIGTYTNLITFLVVQIYLFTISWESSLMLFVVSTLIMGLLILMSPRINKTGHIARVEREKYANLITGLINGFKELVLHKVKREKFQDDLEESSLGSYKASQENINVGIDASLFSELSFTIAIGVSCLFFPLIFDLNKEVITAYVLAVLYLWGPVGALINGVPQIVDAKVSWKRIKNFLGNAENESIEEEVSNGVSITSVQKVTVKDVCFNYESEEENIAYGIGPINFEVNEGELVFIIGGNGSGKTTFLKLLVGLYKPDSGAILINDKNISNKALSECFSVIYSDFYLFKKLYDVKEERLNQVYDWLKVLQLSEKVTIENGVFSTIELSKGQRKRLAILKSYLEDRPIYFFDEVAADLDPAFRDFFYNELLVKMREEGKILIIISHDDKYFGLADNIYKMEMGQISCQTKKLLELSTLY